jgi:tetratricopeptide (TPR) repeat protein
MAHLHGRAREAEDRYLQAIALCDRCGPDCLTELPSALNTLAVLYFRSGRYELAMEALTRAHRTVEQVKGRDHPELVSILLNQGLYTRDSRTAEAAFREALRIAESVLGANHPDTAEVLRTFAWRLRKMGKKAEAKEMERRAKAIRDSHWDTLRNRHTVDLSELSRQRH